MENKLDIDRETKERLKSVSMWEATVKLLVPIVTARSSIVRQKFLYESSWQLVPGRFIL